MKNIIITVIISIFLSMNTFSQDNHVRVIAKGNCSQLTDNIYTIDIFVKALNTNETVTIAEQNYRFDFNDAALTNPTVASASEGLGYNNPVESDNGNFSIFSQPTLTGSAASLISFNIEMAGGDGLPLTNDEETYIGSIAFEVLNPNLPYNFNWHHFVGSEENWPPTSIIVLNTTETVTGVFNDDMDLANEITRTGMVVCTENDGSLRLDWPDNEYYYDLYVSMDGGQTFVNNAGEDEFTAYNLPAGDYDMRVKIGEEGCVTILDDINIIDLSHEVTRNWGYPTCGVNNGWLELTWVKKALPKIDISIDGGQNYVKVNAADEFYRVENLTEGDYDIRVKWSYAPYACPTTLDDINLRYSSSCKLVRDSFSQILIHPNPANQQVTINLTGQQFETGTITIFDVAGKKAQENILMANQTNARINTSQLTNGIYLLSINTDGKELGTQKLTIAH